MEKYFDLGALKAWVAGLLVGGAEAASHGNGLGGLIVGFFEKLLSFDIPPSIEVVVYTAVAWLLGHMAVWMTSNDLGKATA